MKLTPFLKWAGGKKQLLEKLKEYAPTDYNDYYEPFIGGGAFLLEMQPITAHINDINGQLINAYRQIKSNAEQLISCVTELDSVPCDKELYLSMREKYNNKILSKELDAECAALMIWLNKHCFNGLYRVNSKGLFNVPYNNKEFGASIDPDNIRGISKYLNEHRVSINEGDYIELCKDVKKDDFVYFDSPYIPVSETASFTDYTKDGFKYEDHLRLAELFKELDARGAKIMLSNNNVPLVHELYAGYEIIEVDVRRNINNKASKRKGKEVIICNY